MQAIQTRFKGPTNTKPARIIVTAQAGRYIYSYDELCDETGNTGRQNEVHAYAARLFADRLDWKWPLATGQLPNGDFVHVFIKDT